MRRPVTGSALAATVLALVAVPLPAQLPGDPNERLQVSLSEASSSTNFTGNQIILPRITAAPCHLAPARCRWDSD